ncbi:hypothetical protein [Azospirillum sp.]|uniref:hypothetical protein n=1 Tax=Azospirillum sp. TaxID=34012 RepID=UPI00260F474F|nr:hypothetical protein [Azospirillum sp.]
MIEFRSTSTRVLRLGAMVFLAATLAGCANCTRDPRQAGFGCGVANLAGGVYQEDTIKLQAEADAAQARAQNLAAENDRLRAEMGSLNQQQRRLNTQLIAANDQLAQSHARLQLLRNQRDVDRGRLTDLENQLANLQDRQRELIRRRGNAGDAAEAARIEAEIKRVEAENAKLKKGITDISNART